jgi:hypothetical protein
MIPIEILDAMKWLANIWKNNENNK